MAMDSPYLICNRAEHQVAQEVSMQSRLLTISLREGVRRCQDLPDVLRLQLATANIPISGNNTYAQDARFSGLLASVIHGLH